MGDYPISALTIYCSSSDAVDPQYFEIAREMGRILAEHQIKLVYGGSAVGLMGEVARTVKAHGGHITGIIPEKISNKVPHIEGYNELVVTETMHERKALLAQKADGFIALPGGFGTLEELVEIITLKQLQYHSKPIVILNAYGCYDHLLEHFEFLFQNKLAKPQYRTLYYVAATPGDALRYFSEYEAPKYESKWYLTKKGFQ